MSVNLVLLGIATTISPLFLTAAVLMMTQSQKVRTSWAAACGWFVSVGASCLAIVVLGGAVHGSGSGHRTHWWLGALDVVLGLVLAYLALREWRREHSDASRALPKWANRVGTMSVLAAFGLGLFLPANVFGYAAGGEIVQQHYTGVGKWLAVLLYAVVASLLEFGPVIVLTCRPASRDRLLASWHTWLDDHWQQVFIALFSAASVLLLVKGGVAIAKSL